MSSTPNNNFATRDDDQLDAWDAGFKTELEYFNDHGIERFWETRRMTASYSRQGSSTFGGRVDRNTPDHDNLAPTLGPVEEEAQVPSHYPCYSNTQDLGFRVDDESFGYQHQKTAGQQYLAPYSGRILEFGKGAKDPRKIATYQLTRGPQHHVDDQHFEYQGQYHAVQLDQAPNAGHLVNDDKVQFLGNNCDIPDPTEPIAAGPSAPTSNHVLGAQQGYSIQHVGIVASQDDGDGVAQMSTQDAQPVTHDQQARRTAKGRTTKKVNDIRRRLVRPGPVGGLTLELYNPITEDWDPAIRHADIRDQLLREADAEATRYGGYDFAPAQGENETDRTSFVRAHQSWGPERANRPEINFVFDRPRHALPAHVRPCSQPVPWLWRGYIVLDHSDDPMRCFDDCPSVLSSAVEGFRIDAIQKRNPAIMTLDLWGRLPPQHTKRGVVGGSVRTKELNTTQAITNVAWRWRHKACILSWERRAGWEHTRAFLREFLTPQQLAQNTTRGREDLTKEEVKELEEYVQSAKAATRNKHPVPPPPRRNNVVRAGPSTPLPNANVSPSIPIDGHLQQGRTSPDDQNFASHFPEERVPAQHRQQEHAHASSQNLGPSLPEAQAPIRIPHQGFGNPNSQNLGRRSQAPAQWQGMPQPPCKECRGYGKVYLKQNIASPQITNKPRGRPPKKSRNVAPLDFAGSDHISIGLSPISSPAPVAIGSSFNPVETYEATPKCSPSPRSRKRKAKTLEENDWEAAGHEINNIFERRDYPLRHGSAGVTHVAKKPRHDFTPVGAASGAPRVSHPTMIEIEVDRPSCPSGQEAVPVHEEIETAAGHSVSNENIHPVDAVRYLGSEHFSPSIEEQHVVAPGYKPVVFPIGSTVTVFSPDGVTIQQGVIAATADTIWKQREIAETIRALRSAEAATGVNDATDDTSFMASHENPPESLDSAPGLLHPTHSELSGIRQKRSAPTKEWLFSVPLGAKAFQYPVGATKVCFMESDMEVRRATLTTDSETEWSEISRPETVSILESMQASRQNPTSSTKKSPEQGLEHDIVPSRTPPVIASENNISSGNEVDMEAGANHRPSTAPIAAKSPPDEMNPRHDQIGPESEQHRRGDGHGQGLSVKLGEIPPAAHPPAHGKLESEFQHARSPNPQEEIRSLLVANSAAIAIHDDLMLPPIENHESAAHPHFGPSLRDLMNRGEIRSRDVLKQHAYAKELLSEDEILILNENKIVVPTCLPKEFEWCEDSKRWVARPPPLEDATAVREASPEKDDFNWEDFINPEYLQETGEPN